jgi:hypothetical protein
MSIDLISGKNPGYLVETKTGKRGKTYHREGLVNKKTVVHVEKEKLPLLCDPKSLKIIGYFD